MADVGKSSALTWQQRLHVRRQPSWGNEIGGVGCCGMGNSRKRVEGGQIVVDERVLNS